MILQLLMGDFQRFLRARGFTPRTVGSYYDSVWTVLNGLAKRLHKPALQLEELTRKHLQDYFDDLLSKDGPDRTVGVATLKRYASALRCFFRFLIQQDFTTVNVASLVMTPMYHRQRRPLLSQKDALTILHAPLRHKRRSSAGRLQYLRDASLLTILYEGGLRISEAVGLNVNSLHFDSPRKGACLLQFTGKGRKARTVVLLQSCKLLRNYLAERKAHGHELAGNDPLFISFRKGKGRRITRTTAASLVVKWGKVAGVEQHVHPHLFRAACATHMRWGGASRRAIQDHLGHMNSTMTDWYCHSSPDLVIDRGLICHPLNQKRNKAKDPKAVLDVALAQLTELGRQLEKKKAA